MNANQRRVLLALIALILAMILYPPFQFIGQNGVVLNMGYSWIFSPPEITGYNATVNVFMLLVQWIGAIAIGSIAFLLTKTSPRSSQSFSVGDTKASDPARQESRAEPNGNTASASAMRPSVAVNVLHLFAMALAYPIVRLAGFDGAIPIVIGCALSVVLSKFIVNRIYSQRIQQRTRTIVLWLLPVAYFLTYALLYYVVWNSNDSVNS